jgi:hypothetical protein
VHQIANYKIFEGIADSDGRLYFIADDIETIARNPYLRGRMEHTISTSDLEVLGS